MGREITVLIVDDAGEVRRSIHEMLALEPGFRVVGEGADGHEAVRLALAERPDVVLMDINLPGLDGITAAGRILEQIETHVIMISVEDGHEYFRKAMAVGAKDFLVKPFTANSLASAIRQACRDKTGEGAVGTGRVITVFGPKGGVGASTVAVNLAMLAGRYVEQSILLVDLDLEFGHVASLVGTRPRSSIVDLCRSDEEISPDLLREGVTRPAGLPFAILPAPSNPALAAEVDGDGRRDPFRNYVAEILTAARQAFDWVIVDTAPGFRDSNLAAIDQSDRLILVTTPDVPYMESTAKALHILLDRLAVPRERVHLVLNRRDGKAGLSLAEAKRALDMEIDLELPQDPAFGEAANTGRPAAARRRLGPALQGLENLRQRLGADAAGREGNVARAARWAQA